MLSRDFVPISQECASAGAIGKPLRVEPCSMEHTRRAGAAPGCGVAPGSLRQPQLAEAHRRGYRAAARAYLTAAAEEPHQLNSGASLATILNDIAAFRVGHAFFNLHRLFANKAAQQIDQQAFIVIQIRI